MYIYIHFYSCAFPLYANKAVPDQPVSMNADASRTSPKCLGDGFDRGFLRRCLTSHLHGPAWRDLWDEHEDFPLENGINMD